jgi:hypothetical protein
MWPHKNLNQWYCLRLKIPNLGSFEMHYFKEEWIWRKSIAAIISRMHNQQKTKYD